MGYMQMLLQTYDAHREHIGVSINGQPILLPIFHSTFRAQIEITIDKEGNFNPDLTKIVEKNGENEVTVIPVTEASETRGNVIAPHALCDNLSYIAGDYSKYAKEDKEDYYKTYMEGLKKWVDSSHSHWMIQAVYRYLEKGTVVKDLLGIGILQLDEKGVLSEKINKIHSITQTAVAIRFRVKGAELGEETAVWKKKELYESYIEFMKERLEDKSSELCYVTGELDVCTYKHPANIRYNGDNAKIISANDDNGLAYRGRFTDKKQAVSVGYITSQKAHNTLRWLLEKQGYKRDGAAIVVWEVHGKDLPDIFQSSAEAYFEPDSTEEQVMFDEGTFNEDDFEWEEEADEPVGTGEAHAKKINAAMKGYADALTVKDNVVMIGLDAATKGRMSISYYHEFAGNDFIRRIQTWHKKCTWLRYVRPRKSKKGFWVEHAPSPRDIALAAHGTERNKGFLKADEKLIRSTVERLLPCITNGARIPRDIIIAVVRQASRPETMSSFVWRNQVLAIACALIKYDTYKGEMEHMQLTDIENMNDRDFQFGRLLAVLERIEWEALSEKDEKDENGKRKDVRTTNAMRYWNTYSQRPASTYKIIFEKIVLVQEKMKPSHFQWYQNELASIIANIELKDFNNKALGEKYLIGYSLQRNKMKKGAQKDKEQEVIENE